MDLSCGSAYPHYPTDRHFHKCTGHVASGDCQYQVHAAEVSIILGRSRVPIGGVLATNDHFIW